MQAFDIEATDTEDANSRPLPDTIWAIGFSTLLGFVFTLCLVLLLQIAVFAGFNHQEFLSILAVIGLPTYVSYLLHIVILLFRQEVLGEKSATWKGVLVLAGASVGVLVLLLSMYYMIAERSLLPTHNFLSYVKAGVMLGIPYVIGMLALLLGGQKISKVTSRRPRVLEWIFLSTLICVCLSCAFVPMLLFGRSKSGATLAKHAAHIRTVKSSISAEEFFKQAAGDWKFVEGLDGTLYNKFRLVPVPRDNSECQAHINNGILHPLGSEVRYCFVGLATGGPTAENIRAGHRFPPRLLPLDGRDLESTFFIVVSEAATSRADVPKEFFHVLRFFPLMYNVTEYDWNEDYTKKIVSPEDFEKKGKKLSFAEIDGMADLMGFLYLEDFPYLILDLFHGAFHSCYCMGVFTLDKDGNMMLRRFNRWSWDVRKSWVAVKEPADPSALKESRQELLHGRAPGERSQ